MERDIRSNSDRSSNYCSFGNKQKRPTNFLKSLRNDSFKREFVKYLVDAFSSDSLIDVLDDKTLYVTEDMTCFSYKVVDERIVRSIEIGMENSHEEADTKVSSLILFCWRVTINFQHFKCYTGHNSSCISGRPCKCCNSFMGHRCPRHCCCKQSQD